MKKKIVFTSLLFTNLIAFSQVDLTTAMKQLSSAKPGDTITVANGTYRDVEIAFVGNGNATQPIVIKAQSPGEVVISGHSSLRLAGIGVEINGFYFTNGYAPKGAVIEFRSGNEVANHCRITASAIDDFNPTSRENENSWVLMYGRNNRFDHNNIQGKLNAGVTLAVILDEERNVENHHSIDHNYFGERPNLGSNGGETIRVGTSQSSLLSSRTKIEDNLFERCDGEVEVVSIKSCDNIIRNNLFYESAGVLALRHGHRNLVEGNFFEGNNKPYTGGIRVINEGHIIRNNHFYNLAGERFFAALAVMNAVPNSLPNRYHQVKDVVLQNNSWVNCRSIELCVGKDNERTLPPSNVVVRDNLFINRSKNEVFKAFDDISGFRFAGNRVVTKSGQFLKKGFTEVKNENGEQPLINIGSKRRETGAGWYKPAQQKPKVLSGKIIPVTPTQNSLIKAIETASYGDVVQLSGDSEYFVDKPIEINTYLRIEAGPGLQTKPIIRYNGSKGKVAIFTINDGGILSLNGLAFNNEALSGKAVGSPGTELEFAL